MRAIASMDAQKDLKVVNLKTILVIFFDFCNNLRINFAIFHNLLEGLVRYWEVTQITGDIEYKKDA